MKYCILYTFCDLDKIQNKKCLWNLLRDVTCENEFSESQT
jgi:hypothetical protein